MGGPSPQEWSGDSFGCGPQERSHPEPDRPDNAWTPKGICAFGAKSCEEAGSGVPAPQGGVPAPPWRQEGTPETTSSRVPSIPNANSVGPIRGASRQTPPPALSRGPARGVLRSTSNRWTNLGLTETGVGRTRAQRRPARPTPGPDNRKWCRCGGCGGMVRPDPSSVRPTPAKFRATSLADSGPVFPPPSCGPPIELTPRHTQDV